MKLWLRILSLDLAVIGVILWLALGANRGWTKTSVTHWQKDPVTDIDGPVIEKRFVPGIELLAVWLAANAALFGVSFLCRNKQ
jgi:hypothetical protein